MSLNIAAYLQDVLTAFGEFELFSEVAIVGPHEQQAGKAVIAEVMLHAEYEPGADGDGCRRQVLMMEVSVHERISNKLENTLFIQLQNRLDQPVSIQGKNVHFTVKNAVNVFARTGYQTSTFQAKSNPVYMEESP